MATSDDRIVPAATARHGDHLCCAFDSPAQQEELTIEFVRAGLEQNDRVWYFADANEPQHVLEVLDGAGIGVERALARGQLSVFTAEGSYLHKPPFSPERMLALVNDAVDEALAAGYHGIHVLVEMEWAARGVAGAERLEEWERLIEGLYATRPVTGLCQFDRRRFEPARLEALIGMHAKVAQPPLVSDNGLLRVSEPRRDEHGAIWLGLAGEGDLSSIKVLKRALAGADGAERVHIDTSRLEFLDLASARYLIGAAAELRPASRIVLHHPRRAVRRLFEILAEHGQAVELAA